MAPGYFFYHHIAKTAGTSWSSDISLCGRLRHCTTHHLVGPGSEQVMNDTIARVARVAARECNLFNREGGLATSLQLFKVHTLPVRLILLLRHPVKHVQSMYVHCQGATGWLRKQREIEGHFRAIGFAEWLRLFEGPSAGGWRRAWPYCYYNPANYQSHLLVATGGSSVNDDSAFLGGSDRLHMPVSAVRRLQHLLHSAFFVGVTEYYRLSLCLLKQLLAPSISDHHSCSAASVQDVPVTHVTYDNNASSVVMSTEVIERILALTQIDSLAYAIALERLAREAQRGNASLWRR